MTLSKLRQRELERRRALQRPGENITATVYETLENLGMATFLEVKYVAQLRMPNATAEAVRGALLRLRAMKRACRYGKMWLPMKGRDDGKDSRTA